MQFGTTALIMATGAGFTDCARLLLDSGANFEARDNVRRVPVTSPHILLNIYIPFATVRLCLLTSANALLTFKYEYVVWEMCVCQRALCRRKQWTEEKDAAD
jgi:hypothetical protein